MGGEEIVGAGFSCTAQNKKKCITVIGKIAILDQTYAFDLGGYSNKQRIPARWGLTECSVPSSSSALAPEPSTVQATTTAAVNTAAPVTLVLLIPRPGG
jgi:hypothetical protein